MLSPLPRHSGWATFAHSTQPYQPSPKGLSGRPAHRPFRGLLSVHSRYGLHTRAVTVFRDTLTEGFSHFVTSIAAPVASGWSVCRVGFAPTGERRLGTAHTLTGHSTERSDGMPPSKGTTFNGCLGRRHCPRDLFYPLLATTLRYRLASYLDRQGRPAESGNI